MIMALPDFLIVGAMKCGTSTLAAQLAAQPGIFMTTPKEPNFFSDDEIFARGLPWYERLFDAAAPEDIRGEASTHYTKLPTYPDTLDRMQSVLPSPRLIYVVRDPIERAISHYIHEWTEGRMSEDPVAAFERHPELVDYGCYAMQIAPYLDIWGREAVLLTSLERIKAAPGEELRRVGAHLGLAAQPVWQTGISAQNVSSERYRKLTLHNLLVTNPVATSLRRALVPRSIRRRIRDARKFGDRPKLPTHLVAQLKTVFAEDLAELKTLFPVTELGFEATFEAEPVP
jgi:hypothetical protein